MPKQHKISWLNIPGYIPETWNPIVGCTKISEGCEHCYAERMANRLANNPKTSDKYTNVIDNGKWSGLTNATTETVFNPPHWSKPRAVFVCSMGDLFHDTVSFYAIDEVMNVIFTNPQHLFIIITKRPENMADYFKVLNNEMKDYGGYEAAPNLWLGVTAENQQRANERIPVLLRIPAAKRFVSMEPMLEHISISRYFGPQTDGQWLNVVECGHSSNQYGINWVIVGGETGPGARPMQPDWVRSVRDQTEKTDVPFFFKQFGKKILGCELDGETYHEFPKIKL